MVERTELLYVSLATKGYPGMAKIRRDCLREHTPWLGQGNELHRYYVSLVRDSEVRIASYSRLGKGKQAGGSGRSTRLRTHLVSALCSL